MCIFRILLRHLLHDDFKYTLSMFLFFLCMFHTYSSVSARDEDFNVLKLLLCLADFGAVSSSAALFDSTGKMLNVWQGRVR